MYSFWDLDGIEGVSSFLSPQKFLNFCLWVNGGGEDRKLYGKGRKTMTDDHS